MNAEDPAPGGKPYDDDLARWDPLNDAARVTTSPFSYAELGEMLKQIPSGSEVDLPSTKMFDTAEMV